MEEPNNDIDTETLQAQIDLSMAYAQNLITSWLPTSGPMNPSSSRAADAEAELQEILRRPPRLGVGAPIPETPASAQTRLVQKLEGSKKRAREMENGTQAPVVNNDEQREGDSTEESRAAGIAIRKRQRVDPFESGGKKKKKKLVVGMAETAQAMDDVEMKEAPQSGLMTTDDAMTKSGPKKKKKKKHRLESQGAQGHDAPGPVSETRSALLDADTSQLAESSTQSSLPEEWDGILQDQLESRSGTAGSSCRVPSPVVGAPPPILSPRALPSSLSTSTQTPTSIPSATSTFSLPILNLTGAPPIAPDKTETSSPKKRRRRKKKKKSTTGQGPDDGPP